MDFSLVQRSCRDENNGTRFELKGEERAISSKIPQLWLVRRLGINLDHSRACPHGQEARSTHSHAANKGSEPI